MPGHLNLDRPIDPTYVRGRILIQHVESGDVFTITPIAGWNQGGDDWVRVACADPAMKFRFVRDEIAPDEIKERADPEMRSVPSPKEPFRKPRTFFPRP